MKHILCPALTLLLLIPHVQAQPLVLSKDSKTDYVIVLPAEPTAVEQTAAKELKEHLEAVTGAEFAIAKEDEADVTKPQLLLGNSKRLKELLPDLDVAKIPYDGIVIKTVGNNLILVGHPQRGTLYAVNTFLEDTVGVRWWTSTESFIPKKPTLEIPIQNVEYAPKLIYRITSYRDVRFASDGGKFATRMKCNGNGLNISPEYGGHHQFYIHVHSFFPLLPPKEYFEKHPEWYSEIDGQRKHERAQLCLTNEEMRAELTKNALAGLRRNPQAKFISISQNDWAGYCTCAKCKAIDDEEESHAGTLLHFVNKVAEEIEKEFPDVWVETLAYQYTRKPPKFVKPRKNVIVRLCTIECCFVQPLGEGEHNKPLREDIQNWSKITENLFIWDYTVNFSAYMLPHPNHRVLAPNLRFFVDHNVIGLLEQGDSFCAAGDFVRMKNWVISKLMWNPDLDENKLFDEFLNGYYGSEYGQMFKEYLQILHDRAEQSGVYLRIYMKSINDWLDYETWLKAYNIVNAIDTAHVTAENEVFFNRAQRDSLPINLVLLREFPSFRRKAQTSGTSADRAVFDNPLRLVDAFFDVCKKAEVRAYREGDTPRHFEDFEADMRARFGPPAEPPEFCKDLPGSSWIDIQSTEFNLPLFRSHGDSVGDEKASNKRAVRMPGNHLEWSTSYHFDESLLDLSPIGEAKETPEYRVYAAVRCDAREDIEGTAMTLGIYDSGSRRGVIQKTLSVVDIRGSEYHWIDLGAHPLRSRMYCWFAPPRRPGEVDAVYIDRIVVVRER